MRFIKTKRGFVAENQVVSIDVKDGRLLLLTSSGYIKEIATVPDETTMEQVQAFLLNYLMENTIDTEKEIEKFRKDSAKKQNAAHRDTIVHGHSSSAKDGLGFAMPDHEAMKKKQQERVKKDREEFEKRRKEFDAHMRQHDGAEKELQKELEKIILMMLDEHH